MMDYGIGEQLTRARLSRNLTIEEAEQGTRISGRFLQALEREDFDKIPAPVFAKGFLRSYSQFLGLNPQTILALFPQSKNIKPFQSKIIIGEQKLIKHSFTNPLTKWQRSGTPKIIGENKQTNPLTNIRNAGANIILRRHIGKENLLKNLFWRIILTSLLLIILGLGIYIALRENTESNLGNYQPNVSSVDNSPTAEATISTSTIKVSKGIVPDVIGQNASMAYVAIEEAGFVVTTMYDQNLNYPEGVVFDQSPPPGIELPPGRTITIMTSTGP